MAMTPVPVAEPDPAEDPVRRLAAALAGTSALGTAAYAVNRYGRPLLSEQARRLPGRGLGLASQLAGAAGRALTHEPQFARLGPLQGLARGAYGAVNPLAGISRYSIPKAMGGPGMVGRVLGPLGAVGGIHFVSNVAEDMGGFDLERNRPGQFLRGAASGAAAGAGLGSIVPGIGSAVGAGVGGLAGGLADLFDVNLNPLSWFGGGGEDEAAAATPDGAQGQQQADAPVDTSQLIADILALQQWASEYIKPHQKAGEESIRAWEAAMRDLVPSLSAERQALLAPSVPTQKMLAEQALRGMMLNAVMAGPRAAYGAWADQQAALARAAGAGGPGLLSPEDIALINAANQGG